MCMPKLFGCACVIIRLSSWIYNTFNECHACLGYGFKIAMNLTSWIILNIMEMVKFHWMFNTLFRFIQYLLDDSVMKFFYQLFTHYFQHIDVFCSKIRFHMPLCKSAWLHLFSQLFCHNVHLSKNFYVSFFFESLFLVIYVQFKCLMVKSDNNTSIKLLFREISMRSFFVCKEPCNF